MVGPEPLQRGVELLLDLGGERPRSLSVIGKKSLVART
jgi:hypothetical protein